MEKATNLFPTLEGEEAQARFLTSPEAVLQSLGLRLPAALQNHLRRSSVPPPPSAPGVKAKAEEAPAPVAVAAPADEKKPRRRKANRKAK